MTELERRIGVLLVGLALLSIVIGSNIAQSMAANWQAALAPSDPMELFEILLFGLGCACSYYGLAPQLERIVGETGGS